MGKLFTKEDDVQEEVGGFTREGVAVSLDDLDARLAAEDFSEELMPALENLKEINYKLTLTSSLMHKFNSLEVGTEAYFYTLESLRDVLDGLAVSLEVKYKTPALEDFTSQYSVKYSHEVTMEGFKEFFVSLWEKIKAFFVSFYNQLKRLVSRITKYNMDLDMYEKYVDKLIKDIRHKKLICKDNIKPINTDISRYLADKDGFINYRAEDVAKDVLMISKTVTELTETTLPKVNKDLTNLIKTIPDKGSKHLEELKKTRISGNSLTVSVISIALSKVIVMARGLVYDISFDLANIAKMISPNKVESASLLSEYKNDLTEVKGDLLESYSLLSLSRTTNKLPSGYNVITQISKVDVALDIPDTYEKSINNSDDMDRGPNALFGIDNITTSLGITTTVLSRVGYEHTGHTEGLSPISNIEDLEALNNAYKELGKVTNVLTSLNKENTNLDKDISNVIKTASTQCTAILGEINRIQFECKKIDEQAEEDNRAEENVLDILNFLGNLSQKVLASYQEVVKYGLDNFQDYSRMIYVDLYGLITKLRAGLIKYIYYSAQRYS